MGLLPAHRYGIFLQIIYVPLLVINIPTFESWMIDGRKCTKLLLISLVFAVGYLGQQVAVGQFSVQRARTFAQYEKDILAGKAKLPALKAIHFYRVNHIDEYYRLLKVQKIYMFRPNETPNSLDKPDEMQRRDETIQLTR